MHRHSVVHCGLGIGLAAGKCCSERISEQGSDFVPERIGDSVAVETVARSVSLDDFKQPCDFSAQDKKSLKRSTALIKPGSKHLESPDPYSRQLCERLVEL
jgi:hypothetical protein